MAVADDSQAVNAIWKALGLTKPVPEASTGSMGIQKYFLVAEMKRNMGGFHGIHITIYKTSYREIIGNHRRIIGNHRKVMVCLCSFCIFVNY